MFSSFIRRKRSARFILKRIGPRIDYCSDLDENLKIIICCYIDINIVDHNERISKCAHLFKVEIYYEKFGQNSSNFLKKYRNNI